MAPTSGPALGLGAAAASAGAASVNAKSAAGKKSKTRKAADPSETEKLLAAKISQLEHDAAGEKDQEQEIGKSELTLIGDLQWCGDG